MSQSEKQKGGTKLRLDPDIEEAVWVKSVKIKTPLNRIVNAMLRDWVSHETANALHAPTPTADAAKIRRAAATARQLADQLESIVSDAPPSEPMLSISYATLISMIQEITKGGPNTSDAEAVARRVRAAMGKDRTAPADATDRPPRRTGSE